MNENDLNYVLIHYDNIKTNLLKTVFYNEKSGRRIKVVRNCRSFGVWVGKEFLPLSKMEHKEIIEDTSMSDDLKYLLSQLKQVI